MDYDLEIISEENRSSDPLFSSIINAMNSMKEATADKIYQKIQKEGTTNYSKPQVDRALASALRYGIFEVKNNRYRVRDDVLDDVDTVYWRMQKKREQTPYRVQDGMNGRRLGQKLDPEKDNLRFRKIVNAEGNECPQCGRIKRPVNDKKECDSKRKRDRKSKKKDNRASSGQRTRKKHTKKRPNYVNDDNNDDDENDDTEEYDKKDSKKSGSSTEEKSYKVRKMPRFEADVLSIRDQKQYENEAFMRPEQDFMPGGNTYDVTDESENDSIPFLSDDDQSFVSFNGKVNDDLAKNDEGGRFDSEYEDATAQNVHDGRTNQKTSNESLKTKTNSNMTSGSDNLSRSCFGEDFDEGPVYSLMNTKPNEKSRFFSPSKLVDRDDDIDPKPNWISGYPEDPDGAVIQSDNVLTIEPRDALALKGHEHTSYIS